MNSLTKFFFYLLFSVLIGALVAPFVYWIIALIPAHVGTLSPLIHSIQQMPFHRYLSRSIQVTALILLWPTIATLKIYRLSDFYLYQNPYAFRDLLMGIIIGIIPVFLMQIFFLWNGWYLINEKFSFLLLPKIFLATIAVAIFEEFFFRGVLLGLCRDILTNKAAIILISLAFAGVHFLNFPHTQSEVTHWWSGLALLLHAGSGMVAGWLAFGAFMTLLMIGIILAWVTVRTGSLFLAIGLHAAWIFSQQLFNFLAHYNIEPQNALLPWFGVPQVYGMVPIGIFPLFSLLITTLFLRQWLGRREKLLCGC
ncbi:MAG: lysostaphin resistance A-like protein [Chthoniobacterales bacterium]